MAKQRVIIRSDSTAEWLRVNPVLALNELVFDYTVGDFKRGDGESSFLLLPYLLDAKVVFRGLFVKNTKYFIGQYVEGPDGDAYRALKTMYAISDPIPGANWKKTKWLSVGGDSSGGTMEGSTITRWEPREYSRDLDVVLYENNLYYVSDGVPRPFLSEDFAEEYDLGLWTLIGGGGSVVPTDPALYLLDEAGRKITDENRQPFTVE